jgi:perosamine synthetase
MTIKLSIPRGIIYHTIYEDLKWLIKSFWIRLDDEEKIVEFENAFAKWMNKKYCKAFPFARTAIYYSLKYKDFPAGSEIIMPPISIKGILDVVLMLGLKPVFVDIDKETLCFDEDLFAKAINNKTKAVIFTYLFGIVPNVGALRNIASKHELFVIEDFSQCLNGEYENKKIGGFGDVGVYSASSIKTLDTYGGGLLVTDLGEINKAMQIDQASLSHPVRVVLVKKIITDLIRNVATNRIVFSLIVFNLIKLINRISPETVVKQTGERDQKMIKKMPDEWFLSYTSLQAKVGLSILPRLEKVDAARVENVNFLKKYISDKAVKFPKGVKNGKNIYWQLIGCISSNIGNVQSKTQKEGVDTARSSLLQISSLTDYPFIAITPNANELYNTGFFVPSYPSLNQKDLMRVIKAFNSLKTEV